MNNQILPTWFKIIAHVLPLGLMTYFLYVTLNDPNLMIQYLVKDDVDQGGIVEKLTVIFLIPGILAGAWTFVKYRKNIKPWWAAYWLLAWVLACFYFAGEEISWGQWYFGWGTPDVISQLNDQNETNLHNMSEWFDQKPRNLVELWIFITGVIFPLMFLIFRKDITKQFNGWLHPSLHLFSAGIFYTVVRFSTLSSNLDIAIHMGSSELREMAVALYLSLFLISLSQK